ncbi:MULTISPECIES: hypothetical protein [unclassified Meiothermus]|uniref:hypothetical protein n=1 Tax=unclassified Meiothermus TaxID=370471 RepID=UPI001F29A0F6|nr:MULTISPECIES: hypothetical protein [unclassified Meiothermus]
MELHFGWTEVAVEGRRLSSVVSRVPALGRRGSWWLLTSLPVGPFKGFCWSLGAS